MSNRLQLLVALLVLLMPRANAQSTPAIVAISVQPEATVFVDRKEIGTFTARTLELAPGRYVFTFNHPEYQPLRRTIDLAAKERKSIAIDLTEKGVLREPDKTAAPSPRPAPIPSGEATLTIRLQPKAQLTIDGRRIGDVTEHSTVVTPGRHIVQVVHADYQPLQRPITIKAGEAATLSINLAESGVRKK